MSMKCRKDVLEINGRTMRMRLGDVNFDVPVNASLLGKISSVSERVGEADRLVSENRCGPEELSGMLSEMLDSLLGCRATERIFGGELPVPADLCDALIFVVRQVRACLGI